MRRRQILPPPPHLPSPGHIIHRLRHQPDSLPKVPSPKNIAHWLREKPRRRRIVALWMVALACLVGLGFAAPRISRSVKGWQARRHAARAMVLIDQQNWADAMDRIRTAFYLRPLEPEVWRAYARLLSRTGQGVVGVEWWQKVAQARSLSANDRRDFAAAALSSSELGIASEQIALLMRQPAGPTPRDLLLAGQLATLRGYTSTATKYAEQILADNQSLSREKLGANLLILSNKTPETTEYKDAFARLVAIARDQQDPSSPQALAVLGRQRVEARLTSAQSNGALDIAIPDVAGTAMSLREIADRLEHNPNSRPSHRMLALELRVLVDPSREDELVAKAIKEYAGGDDETLMALGSWLYSRHRFQSVLDVLPLDRAAERRELLMERIDALAALNRLTEVKQLLLSEYPVLEPAFQHMYLAIVRAKLGEKAAVANEWYRALALAESPYALIGLADYAEKRGVPEVADAAYARLIKKQPDLKSAYLSRFELAQSRGQTAKAYDLALEIERLWPEDDATHMREIYLRLLLTSDVAQAKAAEEEAAPFLARNPWDGSARSAVALAQLKQGKVAAALTTLTEFTPGVPSSAISRAVYAAALEANGWKDEARKQAKQLSTEDILPEERALLPAENPAAKR
jgi:hypothetical protein